MIVYVEGKIYYNVESVDLDNEEMSCAINVNMTRKDGTEDTAQTWRIDTIRIISE